MALKQSNINKIPKRNQYLTYGYVRECEKKIQNMQNIPVMIKHLFLIFWNINRDAFDKQQTHSKINVKDSIEAKLHTDEDDDVVGDNVNSYMENVASSGTHIWRFHLSQVNVFDMIGISRVQSGQRKDKSFTGAIDTDDDYAFRFSGDILTEHEGREYVYETYGTKEYNQNETIEMILNLNDLSLRWKMFDEDCGKWEDPGKAYGIKEGNYRAVISLYDDGGDCVVKLLEYQHIV